MKRIATLLMLFPLTLPTAVANAGEHRLNIVNVTEMTIRAISITGAEIIEFEKIRRKNDGYVRFSIPPSKCITKVRIRFSGGDHVDTRRDVCNGGTMTVFTTK